MKWNTCDAQCQDRGQKLAVQSVVLSDPLLRHPRPRHELVLLVCRRRRQIRVLCRFLSSWGPLPSVERSLILVTFSNLVASVGDRLRRTHSANLHASTSRQPRRVTTRCIPHCSREYLGISLKLTLAVSNTECAIGFGPGPPRVTQECRYGHGP